MTRETPTTPAATEHVGSKDRDAENFTQQIDNLGQFVGNVLSTAQRPGGNMTGDARNEYFLALHDAIEADEALKVKEVSSTGLDLNQPFDASINPAHAGITPLALACALNKADVVEALLDEGADANLPFATLSTTALMTSSYHGHVEVVKLLLERGADVQAVDLQQSTALGYAFGGTRNMDVVQLLLDAHIDVNKKNMLGMNALLLVAGYGNEDLVAMVLDAGADPNTSNDFGHSALHLAVVGKRDTLKKMKRLGSADVVAADRSLNRRNLDMAMQEWARLHKDEIGGSEESQEVIARAGKFMMSLGHQLKDDNVEDEDDREALKKRVALVAKHRQDKIDKNREKRKSGIWNLLSCGGGKASKHADDSTVPGAKPYTQPTPEEQDQPPNRPENNEVTQVIESFVNILRMLIDSGCEIDKTEKTFGMTALDLAILNGDMESAAVLIAAGGDPDHFLKMLSLKELYQAIMSGRRKDVKDLLQCDEDLHLNQAFTRFTVEEQAADEGMTPLAVAVREGDNEIVKMLIKHGARVDMVGPSGRPPISEGANTGSKKNVETLVAHGADQEQKAAAYNDATPLTIAAIGRHHEVVAYLIKRGAKVDKRMTDRRDALIKSVENNDVDMVDQLLMADLDQNFEHPDGFMYKLAQDYQSKDRDTEAILAKVAEAIREIEERERQADTQAQAVPQAQQPQPQRAAPAGPRNNKPVAPPRTTPERPIRQEVSAPTHAPPPPPDQQEPQINHRDEPPVLQPPSPPSGPPPDSPVTSDSEEDLKQPQLADPVTPPPKEETTEEQLPDELAKKVVVTTKVVKIGSQPPEEEPGQETDVVKQELMVTRRTVKKEVTVVDDGKEVQRTEVTKTVTSSDGQQHTEKHVEYTETSPDRRDSAALAQEEDDDDLGEEDDEDTEPPPALSITRTRQVVHTTTEQSHGVETEI